MAGAQALINQLKPLFDAMPPGLPAAVLSRARAILRLKQGRLAEARKEIDAADAIFRKAGPSGIPYLQSLAALRKRIAAAG